MPPPDTEQARRRREFRAACGLADLTQERWAAANDVTPTYLSRVLKGRIESGRLTAKIDAFIREQLDAIRNDGRAAS